MVLPRLNIIGAGKVAQTLARLWVEQGYLQIGAVVTRQFAHAQAAVAFIGQGEALAMDSPLPDAELILLGCADAQLEPCANTLAQQAVSLQAVTVFHCSGALSSALLQVLADKGAWTASVHPVKSFADPALAVKQFSGTFCGMEGHAAALAQLRPLFKAIGGEPFTLEREHKTLYHAASVMACNYLVALEALSLKLYEAAGLAPDLAAQIMRPLVEGTVQQFFDLGPIAALTGPIVRGDTPVVSQQLQALQAHSKDWGELYRLLGLQALQLAAQRQALSTEAINQLTALLTRSD